MTTNKNLTYRFLTMDDHEKYVEFFRTVKTIIKVPVKEIQIERLSKNYSNKYRKNVGAFDQNGEFVAAVTGQFYPTFPVWYCNNQYIKQTNTSLSSYLDFIDIHSNCMKLLTDYGEENGFYSFYVRRILAHQEAHEKLLKIAVKRGIIEDTRYDYLYEDIYGPVATTNKSNHKFFFPDNGELRIDTTTIIILYSLKQPYRRELLSKRYPGFLELT